MLATAGETEFMREEKRKTYELTVTGLVQGVGYRPYAAGVLKDMGINGTVRNTGGIVKICITAANEAVDKLLHRLYQYYPEGARIDDIRVREKIYTEFRGVAVLSSGDDERVPVLPTDICICKNCEAELKNPSDRRYRYPFISCAACGPRYTIMHKIPYDRENTTMSAYEMCSRCKKEYDLFGNRRYYAQTISCPDCGPQLFLKLPAHTEAENSAKCGGTEREAVNENYFGEKAFQEAVRLLRAGEVLAVKNTGGYHLVCDALSEKAVDLLRTLKKRDKKPFAVMFPDTEKVREYTELGEEERLLLEGSARPVVLLRKKQAEKPPVYGVAMESPYIGAMLPSNGLQIMLAEEFDLLVMTSANISGEPMIISDGEIGKFGVPVLGNDREILTPADDSVVRIIAGRSQVLRRGRGYVPEPIETRLDFGGRTYFAAGADMKAAFAFGVSADTKEKTADFGGQPADKESEAADGEGQPADKERKAADGEGQTEKKENETAGRVYLSQCFGDLSHKRVREEYIRAKKRTEDCFNLTAETAVCDRHLLYFSSKYAEGLFPESRKVVHHYSHMAAVLAEHGMDRNAIGFSFDGTGLGEDGTVWGGEALYYHNGKFERAGHLMPVKMTGGDEGSVNAELPLASYLHEIILREENRKAGGSAEEEPLVSRLRKRFLYSDKNCLIYKALEAGINTVRQTSAGRLFDAAAALLGICSYNGYEGQCPCELEYAAYNGQCQDSAGDAVYNGQYQDSAGDAVFDGQNGNGAEKRIKARQLQNPERGKASVYIKSVVSDGRFVADTPDLINQLLWAKCRGTDVYSLAYAFHGALAVWVGECAEYIGKNFGGSEGGKIPVILSGGTFANRLLTELCIAELTARGFPVYISEKVPPGDDGIALGQLFLAVKEAPE